tara:strand:+ start:1162 stop:2289 length:1128 start_codon:yes stop_codon:yes gene_type:complete
MPVTGSGEIQLRADVNQEINGNDSDSNVSLRALSNSAGLDQPDALSEFYGYSNVTAPTLTYNSVSSDYTDITMNYTINWGGASGSYNLKVEIYESSALGGSLYETVTITSASNPPSGDQSTNITITPPSQYGEDDQDYQVIVKAQNSEGTTSEPSSGKRAVSVTQANQYSWAYMQNNSSSGWREYGNEGMNVGKVGSYMQSQHNHPQLGYFTTHKIHRRVNGNKGDVTVEQNVPNGLIAGTSIAQSHFLYRTYGSSSDAYVHNIYPWSVSSGSRFAQRMIFYMIYGNQTYAGYNNAAGWYHNGSINNIGTDYNNYEYTNLSAVGSPTNPYANPPSGFYNPGPGTKTNYSGHAMYAMTQTGASNITATIQGTLTMS